MNLLALETSTHHLSVALWRDGNLTERAEELPNGGSERLLPWVRQLLTEADLPMTELDGIAFGAGPGGFTGLRLACGVAQGLAVGLNLPVVGVSSLEALALAGYRQGGEHLFACIDARMNEVYCAAYRVMDGIVVPIMPERASPPQQVTLPSDHDWIGCGDGFDRYPELLATHLSELRPGVWPTAAAVAQLAAPRFAGGDGIDAGLAHPLYVRDKVALTTAERLARGGAK